MAQEEMKTIIANAAVNAQVSADSTQPQLKILTQASMRKIQDLQTANDELHRQMAQYEKDMNHCADPLTLIAERERCSILIARNTGEISKIHAENEERFRRIAELEERNKRLLVEKAAQKDSFNDIRDPHERAKHASNFFLALGKLRKIPMSFSI